jgi:hypothetical protein
MMKNNFDNDSYTGKMNRIEYWKYHVNSWIKKNSILTISFEELLGEYEKVIKKIGIYIDEDLPKNIIDVRRSKNLKTDSLKKQLIRKHSSISFRKGEVGDWKNHLSKDVQDYISNNVGELLNELKFEENKYYEEKI